MTKSFFLITLLIILFSCKENAEKVNQLRYDLEFNTELQVKRKIHYINNSKYISFYDLNSRKKIEIFTLKGEKVKSIDLSPLISQSRLISYDIISLDSIIFLSKYTNRIFLINDKCEILFEKDYSNLLLKSIELFPPINFENNILKCGISFQDINFPVKPTLEDYIASNKIKIDFPMIFVDSNYKNVNNESYYYFSDSIHSRFIDKDETGVEGIKARFSDNIIYYVSAFSDSVYITNNQNELIKVKSLQSKNFTLKPSKLKDFIHNMNIINEEYKKNGFIWSLEVNNYGTKFCSVFCKKSNKKPKPFTIMIYDKDFTVLKHSEPDPSKFYPSVIMDDGGYYLLQNKKDKLTKTLTFFPYE